MENYYILNLETRKLELHFEKETYAALNNMQKRDIKSNFLWGRNSGCWISRAKEPNLTWARQCAERLGLQDAGKTGERFSFAEQMEQKAERAARRAERYEGHAAVADQRGKALQKPIDDMHGDVAFFTQPNINTSAGRAFTRRRERMFAAFEKGFEELRKSAYWEERAKTVHATAEQKELQDKGFICRRIKERESSIRKLKGYIEDEEKKASRIEAGESLTNWKGETITAEMVSANLEYYLDRLEVVLDELGFYQDRLESLGGVAFSKNNIKPGYIVRVKRWGVGEVVSTGPKNIVFKQENSRFTFTPSVSYAEIEEIVSATEKEPEAHPWKVGDTFACHRWSNEKRDVEEISFSVIRITSKTVTLQADGEKAFTRKPKKRAWDGNFHITVTDWRDGVWIKAPEVQESPEEDIPTFTPEEFAAKFTDRQ